MRISLIILTALFLSIQPVIAQDTALFTPHIERYSRGWIDWDKGLIYATGRAYVDSNRGSRIKAMTAAQLVASANVVKLASGIQLDDRRTMEKIGNGTFVLKLKAFLRYREHQRKFVKNVRRPYAEVTLVTPMHGVKGLTAHLLKHLKKQPLQWQKFPLPDPATSYVNPDAPWLVIDTRQLPRTAAVRPSLFPKVSSSSGQTLYDLNKVHKSAHTQRGLARYVHSNASVEQIMLALEPVDKTIWPAWVQWFNPVSTAWAKPRSRRTRYIVASAQQVRGMARTNLVISSSDAQRLRREDAASKILKECRVIIITSAPIGGIEGRNGNESRFVTIQRDGHAIPISRDAFHPSMGLIVAVHGDKYPCYGNYLPNLSGAE
ncbi:MAG: hypothetical protein U9R29_06000 [Thermodesulfobacteriota bacterium]|nr:hypothetical protein [Thermodesulfobacteriota bacterium]